MKKTLTTALLAIAPFAVAVAAVPAMAKDTIRIATEGAYKPYNFKDASGKLVGFEIDLAIELCKRMKIKCTLVEQAWDGIIPALVAKKYDAIMAGMSIKAEREKVISFSRSYVAEPIQFAALKDNEFAGFKSDLTTLTLDEVDADEQAVIDSLKSALKGKTVGVQTSTTHEAFLKKYLPEVSLKSYDTMDNMVLDLEAGRIDTCYTASTFLLPIMKKNADIRIIGPAMTGGPLGEGVAVGLRKEDDELRKKFSAAIDTMIKDGSLSELAIKWFRVDVSASR